MKKAKETTKRIGLLAVLVPAMVTLRLLTVSSPAFCQEMEKWQIVVSESLAEDEAIKVALDDLEKTGEELGIIFDVVSDGAKSLENAIVVGDAGRNKMTAALVEQGRIKLEGVDDEQGYEIKTITTTDGGRTIIVAGGSVIGDVYGLYWLWDRMRVFQQMPEINVKRVPALELRHGYFAYNKDILREALKYSVNMVSGEDPLNLIPWDSEPERSQNRKHRERVKDLIDYAHSLGIKCFTNSWEFVYHPSLLKETGATLSPSDPLFWDAVQTKYRKLLQAMPELDGVGACTGELTGVAGNYEGFDVMHDGQGCNWSLEERYRTFVKKIYNVVVGEFDKEYFHQTWVVSSYEQHSQPEVYEKIFTEDVPTRNLYVVPMITQNDRWWFQAYNPTFNLTSHNTIAVFQTMNYYESSRSNIFPTFPGQYFQAALQTILAPKKSNLKGISGVFVPSRQGWDSTTVNMYVTFRLAWDPGEDMTRIAEDFASIHFGRAAGKEMGEIYLLSPVAYKYGLYIEPAAYGTFNSLPHIRVGTFPAQGYPSIDNGREHIEFLRKIYLRCKPWMAETLMYLDHGLQVAETMCEKYQAVRPVIADEKLAQDVANSLDMTRLLIQTNNLYVKTSFSYFEYRENPTSENKNKLENFFSQLTNTRKQFIEAPGYGYHLFGVDQLLKNVEQALEDLQEAEQILAKSPNQKELKLIVAQQQEKYAQILKEYGNNAVKFLHWEGKVDGKDLIRTKGSNLEVKHLRYDHITGMTYKFFTSLPNKPVTVVPMDIESRSFRPFVLEQPDKHNDYTATIYLSDYPCHGPSWWKFDLYYIEKTPEELGLEIPWEK